MNLYKLINFFKYGDFVGVELREKNYNNAIFSIYSIRVEPAQWRISPSNENLNAAYKVSPTLRNIKLSLKGLKNIVFLSLIFNFPHPASPASG